MKEIEQPVLVLLNGHPQFIDIAPEAIDLRTFGHVSHIFKVLKGASDFRPVALGLSSDVFEGWFRPRACPVELQAKRHYL